MTIQHLEAKALLLAAVANINGPLDKTARFIIRKRLEKIKQNRLNTDLEFVEFKRKLQRGDYVLS